MLNLTFLKNENWLEKLSSWFFKTFRLLSKTLGIVALTIVDISLSGIVYFIIFGEVQIIQGKWIAIGLSLALTSVSIQLWHEVRFMDKTTSKLIIGVIVLLQLIDVYSDLSIMEVVYGTGNIWRFLTPSALLEVPRTPLWWSLVICIGILTTINEPLVFHILENTKNGKNKRQNLSNIPNLEKIDPRFAIDPRQTNSNPRNNQPTYKPTNLPTNQQTNSRTNPFQGVNWSSLPEKSKLIMDTAKVLFEQTGKISPTEVSRAIYRTSKQKGFVSQVLRENKVRY